MLYFVGNRKPKIFGFKNVMDGRIIMIIIIIIIIM